MIDYKFITELMAKSFKYKNFNMTPLVFFIMIEIFQLNTLWGESIYRRVLHHIQNNYDINKIPWIRTVKNVINTDDMSEILNIDCNDVRKGCNNLNTISSALSYFTNSIYSEKSSMYYHEFNDETKKALERIGNTIKIKFEELCGEELVLSDSNDFKAILLKYEGAHANFPMHYDSELSHYYRTIILIDKDGNCPPFVYFDEFGNKQHIHLEINEAIFFKGSRTYHGVEKSDDPNTKRYVLGFQYLPKNKINSPIPKSICTELSGYKIDDLVYKCSYNIFIIVVLAIISYILESKYELNVPKKTYILICIIIIIFSFFLPSMMPLYIGTNRCINLKILFTYTILCAIMLLRIDLTILGFIAYIFATEMFLPSSIIKKTINDGGTFYD